MDSHDHQMFVRSSKYRHVFGSTAKKELCYEGIRVTKSAHDGNFCAVNPKFLAVVVESAGGGAFVVLPLEKTGRVDINLPRVCGHRGPVTDIRWSPFDDNVIASASEDATVKVWQIPDDGLAENLSEWTAELVGHCKKVSYIEWHPTAENILLSAGADHLCIVWNVETQSAINEISVHRDTIYSISWNHVGSAYATTCKDRMIRVIDARTGSIIAEGEGHQGTKASKIVYLGRNNRLFTTGFSRHSERQYAIWDAGNLSKPLHIEDIDSSSGLLMPFYDYDTNMVYLAGKGDGNVRYFEVVDNAPYAYFLSQFQSNLPQRGLGMLPKRGVDTSKCEVVRFYKLHTTKEICEPLSMIVPRKSEMFQTDIYPPTASLQPALTANEWMSGVNKEPVLMSLKDGTVCPSTQQPTTSSSKIGGGSSVHISTQNRSTTDSSSPWRPASTTSSQQIIKQEPVIMPNVKKETTSFNGNGVRTKSERISTGNTAVKHDVRSSETVGGPAKSEFDAPDGGSVSTGKMAMNCGIQAKPYLRSEDNVLASTATLALNTNAAAVKSDFHKTETNFPQSPTTRITVKRTSSMTPATGRTATSTQSVEHTTPHRGLSRNASDVSDISTTTPVTPLPKFHPRRTRNRQRNVDDENSSCSSTEAINEIDDGWCDNPLYSQQQQRRRQHHSSATRSSQPAGNGGSRLPVDVGPLDDVLMQTKSDRQFSRSNVELHRTAATTDLTVVAAGSNGQSPDLPTQASMFRSEPDISERNFSTSDDVIVLDPCAVLASGSMIDCISVEAPDDTLIKPSRLRASMRQRRTPTGSSSDDMSVTSAGRRSGGMSRYASLRDALPPGAGDSPSDGSSPFQRKVWRAASLREKRTTAAEVFARGTQPYDTKTSDVSESPAKPSAFEPPAASSNQTVVLQGSATKTTGQSGVTTNVTVAASSDGARRRGAAQVSDVLPTFQRHPAFFSKREGSTDGGPTSQGSATVVADTNGNDGLTFDKLLREFQELREKYAQQQEDLRSAREQLTYKDITIRRLENQLRLAQLPSNGYAV